MNEDKWCIRRDEKNYQEINKYFSSITDRNFSLKFPNWFRSDMKGRDQYTSAKPDGYREIGVEEFKNITS